MPLTKFEIHSLAEFHEWLQLGGPAVFQNLNLIGHSEKVLSRDLADCSFLGCQMDSTLATAAATSQCLVLPPVEPSIQAPFDPFESSLYSPHDLYEGYNPGDPGTHQEYFDRKVYLSYMDPTSKELLPVAADIMLLRRMHDATVSEALDDFVGFSSGRLVAIMGGHDRGRDEKVYRDVAFLGKELAMNGYVVVTGGGPGLMEAGNLGAYAAGFSNPEEVILSAIRKLSQAPKYNDSEWLKVSFEFWMELGSPPMPERSRNLGVPTWFYGHEPPNVFATDIAKYFENSIREDGLLAIARSGVIFAEGNAGTVQEIFQDACQNYYRTISKQKSPMVLLGSDYWNPSSINEGDPSDKRKPAYPLLRKLANEKKFLDYIFITDSTDDALQFIISHPPTP
jgi:predicted Rossmann-fold nucleotide-binding protein